MNDNLLKLSGQLGEVLKTPVSIKILEQLSDKQLNYLYHQYTIITHAEKMEIDTGEDLWQDDKKEAIEIIKSVLDYGKFKLSPKFRNDKTANYLKTKLK